jgi:DNA polymerase III alpha subunit
LRVREELRFLEMSVSAHPMAILREEARGAGCSTTRDARETTGERVRVAAVLAAARRVRSRAGTLRFLTLEDETGLLEAVLRPDAYRRFGERITTPGPYLLAGRVRDDRGARTLEIDFVDVFHRRRAKAAR